jgi:fermentation-respiration switch protein FrsA (DUF1100 family)
MNDLDDIDYDDDDESPSPAECCKKCCDSCCCCGAGRMRYLILVATLIVAMGWYGVPFTLIKYTLICGAGLLVYLYTRQGRLLYVPTPGDLPRENDRNPPGYRSPEEHDLPFENVSITTDDGVRLHAWLITQPSEVVSLRPTLLLLHGNAGNVGVRVPNYVQLYHKVGVNMLALEYRGYGESANVHVGERGLITDAKAALRFIAQHPDLDSDRIVIFGRSLGGAVAVALSASVTRARGGEGSSSSGDGGAPPPRRASSTPSLSSLLRRSDSASPTPPPPVMDPWSDCRIRGVILENTFMSIKAMAIGMFPFLQIVNRLLPLLLTSQWRSIERVDRIRAPIMFLSADDDKVVPASHMHQLYSRARQGAYGSGGKKGETRHELHVFTACGHNDMPYRAQGYYEVITRFLQRVM